MMIALTLQDKKTLMTMLHKHYSIDESTFIKAIAENEEEEVELTLKAFSLVGKPLSDKSTISDIKSATILIDKLSSKLTLVKAVKETTGWGLKDSKDFIDSVVSTERIPETGVYAYICTPFKVGPYERITTVDQWKAIANSIPDIKWHFV